MITFTYQGYTMALAGTNSTTIWLKYYQHRFKNPQKFRRRSFAAFARCESLEVIRVPEGVTQIGCTTNHNSYVGGGTFSNCKSLKEIYLPASLTYVSKWYGTGLKFCSSLRAILIPKGTTAKIAPLLEPEVLDKLYEI